MRGRAIARFLEDLAEGDPVAWIFVGIFVVIATILGIITFFFRRAHLREEEERKERKRKRGY